MKLTSKFLYFLLAFALFHSSIYSAGKVYLVLGSDTAIWDGMSTSRYNCTYNSALYTDPSMNGYAVMDPAWRMQLVDSYGTPMKLTWWMMAGNIFRYATNRDMPIPNIMTLYFMKKYHGNNIALFGDELSLHYHTFYWSDYDQDGIYYWNQSLTFPESEDDWEVTLAQFLLEEQVFPVSFRSGWHYMDNDWQHYLDKILPYSMHNDWPAKRTDLTEPMDNTYDWSQSPSAFVPWHPSTANYQVPGDGPGWNVRSRHFNSVRYKDLMDTVFTEAAGGIDQVACFWGHLPETDFISNLEILDSLAHKMEVKYPGVEFRYCTGIEAMQRWLQTNDSLAPQLDFTYTVNSGKVYFKITSDEQLFQKQPYIAIKDIYDRYRMIWCQETGYLQWESVDGIPEDQLAKAGIALTDTVGNQAMKFIQFLPDDQFIDNNDPQFVEKYGTWTTQTGRHWDLDCRVASINPGDSAAAVWTPQVPEGAVYNVFYQTPNLPDLAESVDFIVLENGSPSDTVKLTLPQGPTEWLYVTTQSFRPVGNKQIEIRYKNETSGVKSIVSDVIKLSALVRDRELVLPQSLIDFGNVSEDDSVWTDFELRNNGIQPINILNISSKNGLVYFNQSFPVQIPSMNHLVLPVGFYSENKGIFSDTLFIESDDPNNPFLTVPVNANVINFFKIIDNEDFDNYTEFGQWNTSVAQAWGPSSRYAAINHGYSAVFSYFIKKSGIYQVHEIVPTTVNSTDRAIYIIYANGTPIDSVYVDQNQGSGNWVLIGDFTIPANSMMEIKVYDPGESTTGVVIRADAVKISLLEEISGIAENEAPGLPVKFSLKQNYPNPFNNSTILEYHLPKASPVKLVVFNSIGQKIKTLVNTNKEAGVHKLNWTAADEQNVGLASGLYYLHLTAGEFSQTKKLILLK